jgi:non-heme chloroperoxidase
LRGIREKAFKQRFAKAISSNSAAYFQIKAFSETDMSDDLKKIDLPTLILHGDIDEIVPIGHAYFVFDPVLKKIPCGIILKFN